MNSWNLCSRRAASQKVLGASSQVQKHLDSITSACAGNRLAGAYLLRAILLAPLATLITLRAVKEGVVISVLQMRQPLREINGFA